MPAPTGAATESSIASSTPIAPETSIQTPTEVPTEVPTRDPTATPVPSPTTEPVAVAVADAIIGDPAYLIGDGNVGASPKNGWVYSCSQEFGGGGAGGVGDWIEGDFWHPARKLAVHGEIYWPNAQVSFDVKDGRRVISGNGLPVGHPTGTYPVSSGDPAYLIDRNPNSISAQVVQVSLPLNPTLATTPSCLSLGTIAVALNGVSVFNALDGAGRDAPAHEVLDLCTGHPEMNGTYHYHAAGACQKEAHTLGHTLTGYAIDGFGLFGLYDGQGQEITNGDLDKCHGHTHDIDWDGAETSSYHYHLTNAYPYTIGCFRGSEVVEQTQAGPQGGGGLPPPGGLPPGCPPPPGAPPPPGCPPPPIR